jgi:PAS domain S-box-containing protein
MKPLQSQQLGVLVVDAKEDLLVSLQSNQDSSNLYFIRASSTDGALQVLSNQEIVTVLISCQAADHGTLETVKSIHQRFDAIPIFIVSRENFNQDQVRIGLSFGVSDFELRSVLPILLISKISNLARLYLEKAKNRVSLYSGQYSTLIKHALDAVVGIDHAGTIIDWNRQAETAFGWSCEEALGKKLTELIIPLRYREAHEYGMKRFAESGTGPILDRRVELSALKKNGTEFPIELTVTHISFKNDSCFYSFIRDITTRDKAKKDLQAKSSLLRSIIDSTEDAIFVKDLNERYVLINESVAGLLGKTTEEIIGKDDRQIFSPDIAVKLQENDKEVVRSGRTMSFDESSLFHGEMKYVITKKSPLRDSEGRTIGVVGVSRDFSELKAVEEERDLFFELSQDMLYIAGTDGYLKRVNRSVMRTLGYSREELFSKPLIEFIDPRDQEAASRELDKLKRAIPTAYFESRYRCKSGAIKWIAWSAQSFGSRLFVIARDITDQKEYLNQLEVSESRFRKLFEESPTSIEIFSPEGKSLHINRAWKDLWGLSEQAEKGAVLKDYHILNDPQFSSKGLMPYIERGFSGETVAMPPVLYDPAETGRPGRARRLEAFLYPVKNREGMIREVIMVQRDISDKVQSENVLKLLAETGDLLATSLDYQATLDRIVEIAIRWLGGWCELFTVDEFGKIIRKAAAFSDCETAEILNEYRNKYPLRENMPHGPAYVIRTGKSELIPQITYELLLTSVLNEEQLQQLTKLRIKSYIGVPLRKHGKTFGVISLNSVSRMFNEQDLYLVQELANRASLAIENASLYQEAQRAIRLRDEFLSLASHELKTPLTPLSLQMQTLLRVAERHQMGRFDPDRLIKMFQNSKRQIQSLAQLIEDLLDVSRITAGRFNLSKEQFDLVELVYEVVTKFAEDLEIAGCRVEILGEKTLVGVWDRFRIEQVIINLLTNAMKYGGGKPIYIRVQSVFDFAVLSVQDFGIGIAREDQDRIFTRFERAVSHSNFRGMGLGLYITHEVVGFHGGTISVKSAEGEGSLFTVRLPIEANVSLKKAKN